MTADARPCSRDQVVALHSLYRRWKSHSLPFGLPDPREARLEWASELLGRAIDSFSDLNRSEARELIDGLKSSMGQPLQQQPNPWRRIRSRDRAHAAGTSGRADQDSSFVQLANADDIARINEALRRLGWTEERYKSWLNSKTSPITGNDQVRTVAETNKVRWALKKMLVRSGSWRPRSKKRIRQTPAATA